MRTRLNSAQGLVAAGEKYNTMHKLFLFPQFVSSQVVSQAHPSKVNSLSTQPPGWRRPVKDTLRTGGSTTTGGPPSALPSAYPETTSTTLSPSRLWGESALSPLASLLGWRQEARPSKQTATHQPVSLGYQ